ncbi:MAG: PAS domain S-box protein, partial [Eubacteriales bacterium]|nr:PAS domain S-box protein [Eubacteriales bacterium]
MKDSNDGKNLSNELKSLQQRIIDLEKLLADQELELDKSQLMIQLLDSATDSIFLHDFDGNFVYVNEAAYKTRGYTKEELMRMNLHDLDVPQYEKFIEPRIEDLMEKEESIFETAHFCKDGSQMPVEIHSKIIEYENKPLVLSCVLDITERKKIENDLIFSKEQYRTL